MSLLTALLAGGTLGVRHALEADHLAAVGTLVDEERDLRSAVVGISWGVGHSVPIVGLGIAFVALGIEVPESATRLLEAVVGLVLIVLGARMLADTFGIETHVHGSDIHSHVRLGVVRLSRSHVHLDGDSLLVGVLHGFAGSGALVVALTATAPSLDAALAFLCAFSLLSVLTMGVVSTLWSQTLETRFARSLKFGTALLGIGLGVLLLTEQFAAPI